MTRIFFNLHGTSVRKWLIIGLEQVWFPLLFPQKIKFQELLRCLPTSTAQRQILNLESIGKYCAPTNDGNATILAKWWFKLSTLIDFTIVVDFYSWLKAVSVRSYHINSAKAKAIQQNPRKWISTLLWNDIDGRRQREAREHRFRTVQTHQHITIPMRQQISHRGQYIKWDTEVLVWSYEYPNRFPRTVANLTMITHSFILYWVRGLLWSTDQNNLEFFHVFTFTPIARCSLL